MDKRNRVARAIAYSGDIREKREWSELLPETRSHYRKQADAALAEMGGVRVKPLVWDDFEGQGAKASGFYQANYLITKWRGRGEFEVAMSYPGYQTGFDGERFHPTLEAAKAAAQADYEARILAAIEPAPVSVREAARVLLGHTPEITAKPLAEMSEAMKIDAHPAILLRGFCAALRAIAEGKE